MGLFNEMRFLVLLLVGACATCTGFSGSRRPPTRTVALQAAASSQRASLAVVVGLGLSIFGASDLAVLPANAATSVAPLATSPQDAARLDFAGKKAELEAKLKLIPDALKLAADAKVKATSELTLVEGQLRSVERELGDKKLDATRRTGLQTELSANLKPAQKRKQGELSQALGSQKRAEKEAVDIKARIKTEAKKLQATLDRLNTEDAKRASAAVKSDLAAVKQAETRVQQAREKLRMAQVKIKQDIAFDNQQLQDIKSEESKIANMKKAEQALVERILKEGEAANLIISAEKAEEDSLAARKAVLKAAQGVEQRAIAAAPKQRK